jgi:hypothetical protein
MGFLLVSALRDNNWPCTSVHCLPFATVVSGELKLRAKVSCHDLRSDQHRSNPSDLLRQSENRSVSTIDDRDGNNECCTVYPPLHHTTGTVDELPPGKLWNSVAAQDSAGSVILVPQTLPPSFLLSGWPLAVHRAARGCRY